MRADVDVPLAMAGLYAWPMACRISAAAFGLRRGLPIWVLGVLSVAAGLLTAIGGAVTLAAACSHHLSRQRLAAIRTMEMTR